MGGNLHSYLMTGLGLSKHIASAGVAGYKVSTAFLMDLLDAGNEFFLLKHPT